MKRNLLIRSETKYLAHPACIKLALVDKGFKVVLERERHIEHGKYCVLSREVSAQLDAGCKEVLVNFTKITVTVNSNNFLQPW